MKKRWYRQITSSLTEEAKIAKSYVIRICKLLSKESNRHFHALMNAYNDVYEGHIIDSGNYIEKDEDTFVLSEEGDPIGMIFWGGFYSRKKYKDAMSKAWISLLEDCIGSTELHEIHNLTDHLKDFGPKIDFNCNTTEKLEELLKSHNC